MTIAVNNPMAWFPYTLRPHQDRAVKFAAEVFMRKTVGLLSADCGVGKTIAVLSGYLASRSEESDFRLVILTRTHSQSVVFEEELEQLRHLSQEQQRSVFITATSIVSRIHVCPMKDRIADASVAGFLRGCSTMIKSGQCNYYYNFYRRDSDTGRLQLRENAREHIDDLHSAGVVSREKAEELMISEGYCPYEILRCCARESRVVIGPYSYFFQERVRNALLNSLGIPINEIDIIVDESHNLADHVLNSEAAQLSGRDLLWLRENKDTLGRVTGASWLGEVIDFLWETFMVNLDKLSSGKERSLNRWEILPRFVQDADVNLLLETRYGNLDNTDDDFFADTPLERLVDVLIAGKRALISDDWHITISLRHGWKNQTDFENAEIKARPLNAAGLAAPVLRGARSALLMSGTLNPLTHYSSLLGVSNAITENVASPYPKGSRIVLLDKVFTTKYTERSSMLWRALADRISCALTSIPADKSAMIAFPSYKIMTEVLSYDIDCGFRHRLVEEPSARLEDLKQAVDIAPHAVFCVYGGKFSEGIDLVRNGSSQLDLIIGVGIPFSPPTSYNRALQAWFEQRFGEGKGYYYSSVVPSIRKVAQFIGRLRRSPDDWGVVLLLDKRFRRYVGVFGEDIVSDIWPFEDNKEMVSAINMFLETRRDE